MNTIKIMPILKSLGKYISTILILLCAISIGAIIGYYYNVNLTNKKVKNAWKSVKPLTEISIAINESDQLLIIDKQTGEYVVYQDSIGKTIFYLYANKMYKSEAENNLSK